MRVGNPGANTKNSTRKANFSNESDRDETYLSVSPNWDANSQLWWHTPTNCHNYTSRIIMHSEFWNKLTPPSTDRRTDAFFAAIDRCHRLASRQLSHRQAYPTEYRSYLEKSRLILAKITTKLIGACLVWSIIALSECVLPVSLSLARNLVEFRFENCLLDLPIWMKINSSICIQTSELLVESSDFEKFLGKVCKRVRQKSIKLRFLVETGSIVKNDHD